MDKPSKEGLSKTALRLRNYEIFHRSMAVVLQPLKAAGNPRGDGIEADPYALGNGHCLGVWPLTFPLSPLPAEPYLINRWFSEMKTLAH